MLRAVDLTMRIHGLIAFGLLLSTPLAGCGRDGFDLGRGLTSEGDGGDGGVEEDGGRPDATRPDVFVPDTGRPDATRPDAFVPDVFVPDTGRPDARPDAFVPDAFVPDVFVPDVFVPDVFVPDTGRPDARPDAFVPDVFVPDVFVPDVSVPDVFVPDVFVRDVPLFDLGLPDTSVPDVLVPDSGLSDGGPDGGRDSGLDGGPITCANGCAALDDDCNVGVCGPDGMTCFARPRPPGTACDDGDLCTVGDFCFRGTCFGGGAVDCSALDDTCNVGTCTSTAGCVQTPRPPPAGDSCASPIGLMIAPGGQSQGGSNVCAQDDAVPQCAPPGGRDIVFQATFTETRRVLLETVTPMTGPAFDTALYINRGVCAAPMNLQCNDDFAGIGFSQIDTVLAGGTYFFVVDGASAAATGDFELDVQVDPHDTCANPSILPLPMVGQSVTVRGNTSGNAHDFVGSCAPGSTSPDQVYRLEVPQAATLRLEMIPPGTGPQFDTVLHVRSATCAGMVPTFACDDDAGAGNQSMIERTFPAGTYFVIVDGFGGNQQGEYRLDVTQIAPVTNTTIFPEVGDARQPLMGPFTSAGQFVEGIRFFPGLPQAGRLEMNLQIANGLMCGAANFRVRVNNVDVGTFVVRPNMTTLAQTFSFNAINGPNGRYNIRYEMTANIPMMCGSVELPNSVSTVGLGL